MPREERATALVPAQVPALFVGFLLLWASALIAVPIAAIAIAAFVPAVPISVGVAAAAVVVPAAAPTAAAPAGLLIAPALAPLLVGLFRLLEGGHDAPDGGELCGVGNGGDYELLDLRAVLALPVAVGAGGGVDLDDGGEGGVLLCGVRNVGGDGGGGQGRGVDRDDVRPDNGALVSPVGGVEEDRDEYASCGVKPAFLYGQEYVHSLVERGGSLFIGGKKS